MLISESKRFVFVHVPKTAGTSVMEVFLPCCRLRDRAFHGWAPTRKLIRFAIDRCGWNAGRHAVTGFPKHCGAAQIRDGLGAERYARYFAFAFVRDPFDLVESLYHFLRQSTAHPRHRLVAGMDLPEFVAWHIGTAPRRQIDYLKDPADGAWLVEYVGRYETLAEDVAAVAAHLGVRFSGGLARRNPSRSRNPGESGYDEASRRLVADWFAADFAAFGYGGEAGSASASRWTGRRAGT
jgi:hypothetical protein